MPFGPDLLFAAADVPGFVLHVEICEDMFVPVPPSADAALAGATVLANLSGSPITVARADDRCLLARSASARCLAAYVYAAAGQGESTTDLAWDGQTMIWENGRLPDPVANAESVLTLARECHDEGVAVAVFPELTLSGYSIEDIVLQDALLDAVQGALSDIVDASADLLPVLVVGAPLRYRHRVYNTAVVIHRGTVLGVVPKSYLPTYREFYERRYFAAGDDVRGTLRLHGVDVPFGPDLLFSASDLPGLVLHVEICEDMFVPVPPSADAALAGATVLANLSGSPITVARAEDRSLLARSASARCLAAYVYAAAGQGESTTDLAWDGQTMVWENGRLLAESERFPKGPRRVRASPRTSSSASSPSCGSTVLSRAGVALTAAIGGRDAGQISVADIIRAVEGPLATVRGETPDELDYAGTAVPLRDV